MSVGEALVLTIHVANLSAADANVAGWDVGTRADVPVQFRHKGLAEPSDLVLASAFWIKVASTLAAPEGQAGQRICTRFEKVQDETCILQDSHILDNIRSILYIYCTSCILSG